MGPTTADGGGEGVEGGEADEWEWGEGEDGGVGGGEG